MRVLGTVWMMLSAAAMAAPEEAFFESNVLPILQQRCYECHSHEKKIKGGLALDSRSGWEIGGDAGAAVVPGELEKSPLIKAVRYVDSDLEMPPKAKLPASEIAVLEEWVRMGASDPRMAAVKSEKKGIDLEAGRKHWAFRPVSHPQVPTVKNTAWPASEVDAFILFALEDAKITPAVDSDTHTWLRRVFFDLTGLPPSREDMDRFESEGREAVVDRLLNSRAFGERWARHWLDLTGYADQIGTSNSVFAEHAWRYRDYLIESFNADKPFDRFVQEQIAGDLLPWQQPEERAANLTATGFLVLGDVEIVNPDKLRMEHDLVDQQLSKVGMTFMGMTLGCVRCHDHKFDPIGLEDYYAMAGFFRGTSSTLKIPNGIWSSIKTAELPETEPQKKTRETLAIVHAGRLEELRKQLAQEPKGSEKAKQIAAEIEHAEYFVPKVPQAYAVHDEKQPGDMRITIRGNPHALGAIVPRGVMRVSAWDENPTVPAGQSGRLQFADWLADERHPLTARVTVNRIWQKLFGEGIVRSVDYFGTRGERPSHPELLDYLATRFMREGWSQKRLIRLLVLSRTYGLSSVGAAPLDPDNRLLSRQNRTRLDAEALRDAMLAASGELALSNGGPALPLEYRENTSSLKPQAVNPPAFALRKFRPQQEFERTVYLPVIRSAQPSPARLRDVFDFTQPAQMAGKRSQTVVPTQALFLLNNDLVRKRATALANNLAVAVPAKAARLEELWLRVLNRPITSEERKEAIVFLERLGPLFESNANAETEAWVELCHSLLASNEFIHRL